MNGYLLKKFEKGKSYVMSDMMLRDIRQTAGNLFTGIRELDSSIYHKYGGENLDNKTITIWRTGGMGDLCFITPYLKKIKELWPTSKIVFGSGAQYSDVMSKHPCIDEFHNLPLDTDELAKADYHLMFEGIIENNPEAHVENAYDLFGKSFNIELENHEKHPYLTVDPENLAFFKEQESKIIKNENPVRVGIHLSTSSPIRNIPTESIKKIVYNLLSLDQDIIVYLLGSRDDSLIGNQIPIINDVVGRLVPFYQVVRGFRDTVAAVSCMDLMIGGDSSGLHIAAAFEKPMIGLFGAFKSDLRLRYYANTIALDSKIKCSPCFMHGNYPCENSTEDGTPFCMMVIDANKVVDEASVLLALQHKIRLGSLNPNSADIVMSYYRVANEEKIGVKNG
jgi:ADP-heptose:LPS heptosyltransferase